MLHNTGPYGPGEQPVNMGASLNLSQMNGLNLVNNLSKNTQEQSQAPTGHYNISNYPSYSSQALNMTSQFTQFSNYHQNSFPANFSVHNSTSMDYQSWPNGMLSVNSNFQQERNGSVLNYSQNYDKPSETPINMGTGRKDSILSTPHIYNKEYLGHGPSYHDNSNFSVRSRESDCNIVTKNNEKPLIDSSRRRSLENTVKLIENILLNSTVKHKEFQTQTSTKGCVKRVEKDISLRPTPESMREENLSKKKLEMITDTSSKLYERLTNEQSSTKSKNITEQSESDETKDDKSSVTSDEVSPKNTNENLIPDIEIKVEESSWTDIDFRNPFHHDSSAVMRDNVDSSRIIDCSKSVYEAAEAIKNGNLKEHFYECPHCNILLHHPKRFLIHTKWHTLGINKKTELARKREMKKEARIIEKMKSEEETKPKIFSCKDCEKNFNTKSSLKNHRHRNHSVRGIERKKRPRVTVSSFQCPDCTKRFKHKHSLDKHRDTHLEKTHPCSECPKKFGSQVLLKMHMKSHERVLRGPTFRCTYCGKGYYEAYTLQVHERTHRNERPFSCDICNATFGTNSSLKRHIRVSHSTSKPYECSTCHRCFVSESIRNRHEQRVHGNPDDFKFTCKNCPSRYMKMKDLQRHSCKAHPKTKKSRKQSSDDE